MTKTTSKPSASDAMDKRPGMNKAGTSTDGLPGKVRAVPAHEWAMFMVDERLTRIEAKLDALCAAMADDDDEPQADSLSDTSAPTRGPVTL